MKITIFGDSITNGFGMDEGFKSNILQRLIEGRCPDVKVVLHGINGDDSYSALLRVKYVKAENADLNFVFFGANDASPYHLVRPVEFQLNLTKIIEQLGADKTVLITPPYYNDEEPTHYSKLSEVKLFRVAALELAQQKAIPIIDIFDLMIKLSEPNRFVGFDGLHFTERGYELLADEIVKFIS